MKVRLYGFFQGTGSWCRVAQGCLTGLSANDALAGVYDLGDVDEGRDQLGEGSGSQVAVCIGPLASANAMMVRGTHEHRLHMIAANSTWLPKLPMDPEARPTGFVGTSDWSCDVIRERYRPSLCVKWLHGVSDAYYVGDEVPAGDFSVLHLASTHFARKGTLPLIEGWAKAMRAGLIPKTSKLSLRVDGPRGYYLGAIHRACGGDIPMCETIDLAGRVGNTEEAMRSFYARHHLVCQPSRAEGFGLIPLEARASGVPVLATACTGHADHLPARSAGEVEVVPHGPMADVDDGPDARAPTVFAHDVSDALGRAYERREAMSEFALDNASSISENFSWGAVTGAFLEGLRASAPQEMV